MPQDPQQPKRSSPIDELYKFATNSIIPDKYIDAIDAPSLDRGPTEASLRGFGAGALKALTSPMMILGVGSLKGGHGPAPDFPDPRTSYMRDVLKDRFPSAEKLHQGLFGTEMTPNAVEYTIDGLANESLGLPIGYPGAAKTTGVPGSPRTNYMREVGLADDKEMGPGWTADEPEEFWNTASPDVIEGTINAKANDFLGRPIFEPGAVKGLNIRPEQFKDYNSFINSNASGAPIDYLKKAIGEGMGDLVQGWQKYRLGEPSPSNNQIDDILGASVQDPYIREHLSAGSWNPDLPNSLRNGGLDVHPSEEGHITSKLSDIFLGIKPGSKPPPKR